MIDNCTTCNGLGFVVNPQMKIYGVKFKNVHINGVPINKSVDACPACAVAAEIEYMEWKRHGPAQLSFDLKTDTGPDLPENVLDLRQARRGRQ